jgi:hypothetical protein
MGSVLCLCTTNEEVELTGPQTLTSGSDVAAARPHAVLHSRHGLPSDRTTTPSRTAAHHVVPRSRRSDASAATLSRSLPSSSITAVASSCSGFREADGQTVAIVRNSRSKSARNPLTAAALLTHTNSVSHLAGGSTSTASVGLELLRRSAQNDLSAFSTSLDAVAHEDEEDAYPTASFSPLQLPSRFAAELDARNSKGQQ